MKTRTTKATLRDRLIRLRAERDKLDGRIEAIEGMLGKVSDQQLASLSVYQASADPDVLKVWRNYDVVMLPSGDLYSRKLGIAW